MKKKGKICLFITVLLSTAMMITLEPFSCSFFQPEKNIKALSNSKTTINQYDKIIIDNVPYTIISNGNTIKALSDETIAASVDWTTADANAKKVFTSSNMGDIGSTIFQSTTRLPTSSDLSANIASNKLNAKIPTVSNNWWLGDATSNNRSKFMTSDNKNNGVNTIKNPTITDNGNGTHSCGVSTQDETGIIPTKTYTSDSASKDIVMAKTVSGKISNNQGNDHIVKLAQYHDETCAATDTPSHINIVYNQYVDTSTIYTWKYNYVNDKVSTETYPPVQRVISLLTTGYTGNRAKTEFKKNLKAIEKGGEIVGWISAARGCNSIKDSDHTIASWNALKSEMGYDIQLNYIVSDIKIDKESQTCNGIVNNAGMAQPRPMLTLSIDNILYVNTTRRTFSSSSSLNQAILKSDTNAGTKYLTMKDNVSNISLKSNAIGVSGSDYYMSLTDKTTIDLPIHVNGDIDGKRYVSASAKDKDGNEVYGVLKEVTTSDDTVSLDISNLIDTSTQDSFDLTLYVENSGVKDVSYITEGTDITIHNNKDQNIDFDAEQGNAYEFGDTFTISSHLNDIEQGMADTKINYSLLSNPDNAATIISQSYNKTDGTASVTLRANMGSRAITLAIDKAEGIGFNAAEQKTMTIQLNKKKIKVHPMIPTRKYVLGESVPTFAPISDKEDVLPVGLVPKLIPLDESPPSPGDDTGKVINEGKWKLVYPETILADLNDEALLRDYDITLQDYDDDPSYVFEAGHVIPPADWLSITPTANEDGWNSTDIVIKPSNKAKEQGFRKIAMNNGSQAESITITTDTSVENLSFVFYAETGGYTDELKLSQDIKIDRTEPEVTIDVKKIEVTPTIRLLNILTGGNFYKGGFVVTISAQDTESDIKTITSPNGTGIVTTEGFVKKLEFTVPDDFKGAISATATNKAGLSSTELTKKVINENDNSSMKIEVTKITVPEDRTNPAGSKLEFQVIANQSGLKNVSYFVSGGEEQTLKSYTADDAEDNSITLSDSLTLSLVDIINNSDSSLDHIPIKVKATTNSGNSITKDVDIYFDTVKPVVSIMSIENEDIWASATGKKVNFQVVEEDSGIDTITVIKPDGTKAVVTGELTGSDFSFIADTAGSYTIEATDKAGNSGQIEKAIIKIDADVPVISDVLISPPDSTWSKDDKTVTFHVKDTVLAESGSGVKKDSITVTHSGESVTPVLTCTGNSEDISCSFMVSENDVYTIQAKDEAGNPAISKEVEIEKIDSIAPEITDVKVTQDTNPLNFNSAISIFFKVNDKPDIGSSDIAENGVGYRINDTETLLTPVNEIYNFTVTTSGVYTIYARDQAGNVVTKEITISVPDVKEELNDITVYSGDKLALSLKTQLNDTVHENRKYEWYYINDEGVYTPIKNGNIANVNGEQTVPFPYDIANGSQSGSYICLITNGDGFYIWSNSFKLTVLSEPVEGFVLIPTELKMKNANDGSETAFAEFDVSLSDLTEGTDKPSSVYHITAPPQITLSSRDSSDVYSAALYKKQDSGYELYRTGDLVSLSYKAAVKQSLRLITPINTYHDQGIYQGVLHVTIRYGEGGTSP